MSCVTPYLQPSFPTAGGGGGGVSSVGLAMPASLFSVSGSPVTTSGTLTASLLSQTAGRVLASPPTSSGVPTFQQLQAEHLNPTYSNGQVLQTNGSGVLSWVTAGGGGTVTSVGLALPSEFNITGSPVTTSGTLTGAWASVPSRRIFAAPPTSSGVPTFLHIQAEHLNPTYSNGQVLQTNGSGTLSWVTPSSGGNPSAPQFSVQINGGGFFFGSANLQYNGSELLLQNPQQGSSALRILTGNGIHGIRIVGNGNSTVPTLQEGCIYMTMSNGNYPGLRIDTNQTLLSSTRMIRVTTDSSIEAFTVYNSGRTSFRGSTYNSTAIIEMPFVTGDTIPTLYVGGASSNQTAISVVSGSAIGIDVVTQYSSGIRISNLGIGLELVSPGGASHRISITSSDTTAAIRINKTNNYGISLSCTNSTGIFIFSNGGGGIELYANNGIGIEAYQQGNATLFNGSDLFSGTRTQDLYVINVNQFSLGTFNAFIISRGERQYLSVNQNGLLAIRTGLDTTNKTTSVGGQMFTSTTEIGNTTSGEQDLHIVPLQANALGTLGDRIEVEASFIFANNANSKTVRLYFGSTIALTFDGSVGVEGTAVVRAIIIRDSNSGTSQYAYATFNGTNIPLLSGTSITLPNENPATVINVKFTATATATNDIRQRTMSVKWYPKGQG